MRATTVSAQAAWPWTGSKEVEISIVPELGFGQLHGTKQGQHTEVASDSKEVIYRIGTGVEAQWPVGSPLRLSLGASVGMIGPLLPLPASDAYEPYKVRTLVSGVLLGVTLGPPRRHPPA